MDETPEPKVDYSPVNYVPEEISITQPPSFLTERYEEGFDQVRNKTFQLSYPEFSNRLLKNKDLKNVGFVPQKYDRST